jgi:hypothetical protein
MVKLLLPISKSKGKPVWFKNYPHMKTSPNHLFKIGPRSANCVWDEEGFLIIDFFNSTSKIRLQSTTENQLQNAHLLF